MMNCKNKAKTWDMKIYNKRYIQRRIFAFCAVTIFILFAAEQKSYAQDEPEQEEPVEKIKARIKVRSEKGNDNSRKIIGLFTYRDKETKEFFNVKGVPINFYVGTDSLTSLGTFTTDENGEAICIVKPTTQLPKNEEGYIYFSLEFEGNKYFRAADNDLNVIDLDLKMDLGIIDSVKKITIHVEKILANDERVALNEEEISIYVQRMFSQLKIGTVSIEEGEGVFEFPDDIPGDTLGMVTILAKVVEHDDFASVSKSQSVAWGVITDHYTVYHPRSLWTQVAPIWMIVTLSIMLLGVWGHYIFVIYQLVRLKRKSKKVAEETVPE